MKTYPADAGAAGSSNPLFYVLGIDAVAEPDHSLAGPRSGGHAAAHGGGVNLGQQRLIGYQRVGIRWVGLGRQSAPLQESQKAAQDLGRNT